MLSSSYKKKCSNFHKKLTEPLQLTVHLPVSLLMQYLSGSFSLFDFSLDEILQLSELIDA